MRQLLVLALLLAPFAGQASAQEAGCSESKAVAKSECTEQAAQAACETAATSCETSAKAVAKAPAQKRGWCDRMTGAEKKVAQVAVAVPVQDPTCDSKKTASDCDSAKASSCDTATVAVAVEVQESGSCSESARLAGGKAESSCSTAAQPSCDSAAPAASCDTAASSCDVATVAVAAPAEESCDEVQSDCGSAKESCEVATIAIAAPVEDCQEPSEGGCGDAPKAKVAAKAKAIGSCGDAAPAKESCEVATIAIAAPVEECQEPSEGGCCGDAPKAKAAAKVKVKAIGSCESEAASCESEPVSCEVATIAVQAPAAETCQEVVLEECREEVVEECQTIELTLSAAPALQECEEELEITCTTESEGLSAFRVQQTQEECGGDEDCGDCDGSECGDCDEACGGDAPKAQVRSRVIRLDGSQFGGLPGAAGQKQVQIYRAKDLKAGAPMTWTAKGEESCGDCDGDSKGKGKRQMKVMVMTDGDAPHGGYFTPKAKQDSGKYLWKAAPKAKAKAKGKRRAAMAAKGDCDGCCCCNGETAKPRRQAARGRMVPPHQGHMMRSRMMAPRMGMGMMRGLPHGMDHGAGHDVAIDLEHCSEGGGLSMAELHEAHGLGGGQIGIDLAGLEGLHHMVQLGDHGDAKVVVRGMMVGPDGEMIRFGEWDEDCDDGGEEECGDEGDCDEDDGDCGDCDDACKAACEGEGAAPQVLRYRAEPAAHTVQVDRAAEIEKRIAELEMQLARIESLLDSIANG